MSHPTTDGPRSVIPLRGYRLAGLGVLVIFLLAGVILLSHREIAIRLDAQAVRRAVDDGRYSEASGPLRRWLEARPDDAEAHYLKARVMLGLDHPEETLVELERARSLKYRVTSIEGLRGIVLARTGQYAEAEPLLLRFSEESPKIDPEAEEALTRTYLATFRFTPALAAIDRWIRAAPGDPRPYLWRTEVHTRTDADWSVLASDFREALRRDPESSKARFGLAEALHRGGQYDEAAEEYNTLLASHPDDPDVYVGAARNEMDSGNEQAAIRHLDRALKLAPDHAVALNERAGIALSHGDAAAALHLLDRAIRVEPHDPVTRHRRTVALTRLGRHDEVQLERDATRRAREDQERIIELRRRLVQSPHDTQTQIDASRWMIDHGHMEEGIRWAEKVIREHPNHPGASRLLSDTYMRLGNHGLANYYRILSPTKAQNP
jgi:tetratricopeptide (TPR) repeat protein